MIQLIRRRLYICTPFPYVRNRNTAGLTNTWLLQKLNGFLRVSTSHGHTTSAESVTTANSKPSEVAYILGAPAAASRPVRGRLGILDFVRVVQQEVADYFIQNLPVYTHGDDFFIQSLPGSMFEDESSIWRLPGYVFGDDSRTSPIIEMPFLVCSIVRSFSAAHIAIFST